MKLREKLIVLNLANRIRSNPNFLFTLLAKVSDLAMKFGILLVMLKYGSNELFVKYTYFLSLGAILGVVFDWGGARQNVRSFMENGTLPINIVSVFIGVAAGCLILLTGWIKYYDFLFIGMCLVYAVLVGWIQTLIKYFEYINENKVIYKTQLLINSVSFFGIVLLLYGGYPVYYAFSILIFGNSLFVLYLLMRSQSVIKVSLDLSLLKKGVPFLINSMAVLAFSQINIVVLNQFAGDYDIGNYVLAQRLIDISLIASNAYSSSEIGRFFKEKLPLARVMRESVKIWAATIVLVLIAAIVIPYLFEGYSLVPYLTLALLPISFVRSIRPNYSIVLDYTKYYKVRTYAISAILVLNISFSQLTMQGNYGIFWFCLFIDILIAGLLFIYIMVFRKYNIYETFHH